MVGISIPIQLVRSWLFALPLALGAVTPQEVTDYWLGPAQERTEIPATRYGLWFGKDPRIDREIDQRFGAAVRAAANGDLYGWLETDQGALALLILLDQFPRNIYRNSSRAFATDAQARAVAWRLIEAGRDQQLLPAERLFIYLPLEHSELLRDQETSVKLFEQLGLEGSLDYACRHKVIIERFGRFPHRNAALGRKSSPEETEFLKQPGSSF